MIELLKIREILASFLIIFGLNEPLLPLPNYFGGLFFTQFVEV